jgi:aspartate kinase
MALVVMKFGGTSVGSVERILNTADKAIREQKAGHKVVLVVSAMSGETDALLKLAKQVNARPPAREMDMLWATGEQKSVALVAMAIQAKGAKSISLTGQQCGIKTDHFHTRAKIKDIIDAERVKEALARGEIPVVAGFQGINANGDITTLGRGASDLTAVALAGALQAERCDIYTDVRGIYTADPNVVKDAWMIPRISYDEILELASSGAKVMQARSVELGKKFNVPIQVRSSLEDVPGTWIVKGDPEMEDIVVSGAAVNINEAKVTVRGVPDKPGLAADLFGRIAARGLNIDMIIQNISAQGKTDMSFTVLQADMEDARDVADAFSKACKAGQVEIDKDIAKLSIVGIGMRSHSGVAALLFDVLAKEKINIQMISTSEIKISVVISAAQAMQALKAVHKAFELDKEPAERSKALMEKAQ